jgi:hypothetical protein
MNNHYLKNIIFEELISTLLEYTPPPTEEKPPRKTISKSDAKNLIKGFKGKDSNEYFTVYFVKKNGQAREINANFNGPRLRGGTVSYDYQTRGYIVVYDVQVKWWRIVNTNTIYYLRIGNQEYDVR